MTPPAIPAPPDPAPPSAAPTISMPAPPPPPPALPAPAAAAVPPAPAALLLRAREAAALCAVSLATWWRWHAAGRCPAPVRNGSTVRWRAEELRSWVEAGMPARKEWAARRAANASGRPR
jgi:predicted DNA-binding transcriptional regulator AlpA